jgi:Flp pilus assembly protein TadG
MKRYLGLFFTRTARAKPTTSLRFVSRFLRDDRGSYIVLMAIGLPALVSIAGLGTEGGYWLYTHRVVQSAADNAAYSAAAGYATDNISANITPQAKAVAANNYNLIDGQNGVTVTVNMPPVGLCGATSYVGNASAIEVAVQQSLVRYFSGILLPGNANICGRAVALLRDDGDCMLALAKTGPGITVAGANTTLALTNCSIFSNSTSNQAISVSGTNDKTAITADSVGAVGDPAVTQKGYINGFTKCDLAPGCSNGDAAILDPYSTAATSWPQIGGTAQDNCTPNSATCTSPLSPGTYAGGISFGHNFNNQSFTMQPGIYYLSGDLNIDANNFTLTGTNVTIVLLGNSGITGSGNSPLITITAPTTGWNAGLAIWAPTSNGTLNLGFNNSPNSQENLSITGLIYAPAGNVTYGKNSAGSATCTQIVASTISIAGGNNASLTGNCFGTAGNPKKFGELVALVE